MACDTYVNKSVITTEYEKKKESERRRKLRLLQVRQQSKDFSDKLRQTIQAEIVKKQNAATKSKMQAIRDRKMEELKHLKDMYGTCLENIGLSHKEAAKEPNINLIKQLETAEKSKEAAIRGSKARKQQLVEKRMYHQKMNAPIEQKRETRNRENMRSFFVSCLPQKTTELKKSSRSPKKVPNKKRPENIEIVTELPSNLKVPQVKPPCIVDANKDTIPTGPSTHSFVDKLSNTSEQSGNTVASKLHENNHSDSSIDNVCSCGYLVCPCHFPQRKKGRRRRCLSESSISSDHSSEAKKFKKRTRSCSPHSVRTLNYCTVGNVYESKEPNFAEVKHHPKVAEFNLQEDPNSTTDNPNLNNINKNEELQRKTEERCSKALQREQLKKDFLQLLQDLKSVNREKLIAKNRSKSKATVYQRERDILAKNDSKQKKLANAFETLLQTVKHNHKKNKGLLTDFHHSQLDSSSPPTLNLATYQQKSMEHYAQPRRFVSPEEETQLATCNPSPECRKYTDRRPCPEEEHHYGAKQYSERGQCPPKSQLHTTPSVNTEKDCFHPVCYPQEANRDKRKKPHQCNPSPESGTSYYSLPEHLTPSQQRLLDELLVQVKKKGLKPDLKLYIQKLLSMSRESIENLPNSPRVDRAGSPPNVNVEESMRRVAELEMRQ